MRQAPAGTFTERVLAEVPGPAHVQPVDLDRDGDLDLAVASLGVLFPNNARIGAVIAARERRPAARSRRTSCCDECRAWPTCGPATSTATATSTCRWRCSATTRARRAGCENTGGWRFESQTLQELSGPINAEIADVDGDRDLDIVTLVSQQWEEIYVFVNDGRGGFTPRRIFGASNEDFGSSWISLADLDADGDPDVVYSNGDAFDYATADRAAAGTALQWLENAGGVAFTYHRIADIPGASSPQAADLDGDGDLDIAVVSAYNNWASPDGAEPGLARERRQGRPSRCATWPASPTHLVTLAIGDLDRRRPSRSGDRRHAHELAVRSDVAPHAVDQRMGRRRALGRRAAVGDRRSSPRSRLSRGSRAARSPAASVAARAAARRRSTACRRRCARRSSRPTRRRAPRADGGDRRRAGHGVSREPAAGRGAGRLRGGRAARPARSALDLPRGAAARRARRRRRRRRRLPAGGRRPRRRTAWRGSGSASWPSSAARLDEAAAAYARARDAPPAAAVPAAGGRVPRTSVPLADLRAARAGARRARARPTRRGGAGARGDPRGLSGVRPGAGAAARARSRARRRTGGRRDGVRGALRARRPIRCSTRSSPRRVTPTCC